MPKFSLGGSERQPLPGARAIGKANPDERLEVSVLLRHRDAAALKAHVARLAGGDRAAAQLSRDEFARRHGADPADAEAVRAFAAAHGLVVAGQDLARRTLVLGGTVAQFNAAFGVDLQQYEHAEGSYRGRVGAVHLPSSLKGVVEAVLGLDDRPMARPHFRRHVPQTGAERGLSAHASAVSYTPTQLAKIYGFPPGDGKGQCIAIVELGGGYRAADLHTYFERLGVPMPSVSAVSVDHGRNRPNGNPDGADGEVMLDIEVAGAVAPAARIAVYFAPNTDAGFLDAVTTAIHDPHHAPSVVSISWGGPESSWTPQSMNAFDQAFQAAAALGVSVCVASGDNGSDDGVGDGRDHVDFPASSPHVLACGGTALRATHGRIDAETVWNDGARGGATGGGVSTAFARPPWQEGLKAPRTHGAAKALTGRGVPDVAGVADPLTGYQVRIDGTDTVIGGTSAVAPLWAGLIARINAAKGRPAGFFHTRLYAKGSALNDVTHGSNGDFAAGSGWDACTGLGSPDGAKVAALL